MNQLFKTVCCGLILLPGLAQAEIDFGGQVVLGYGEVEGEEGEAYGILDLTLGNEYDLGGTKIEWNLRGRVRSEPRMFS